ncbi:transposase family protein [Streptomyces sp. NBC_01231]|nr:transposase family protein [Streptomyces sp. NBC_01231]
MEDRACRRVTLIPTGADQPREQSDVAPEEVPGLPAPLTDVVDPRDPREVRHHLAAVLALTACAIPAETTSQYTFWSRTTGQGEPDTPPPSPRRWLGTRAELTVTWPALQATRYLDAVAYADGSSPLGCTASTVTP